MTKPPSNTRFPELSKMKYFYEVARLGSVTHAARSLRISQPAVSKMIHAWEEELNINLFRKAGRNLELTQSGQKVLEITERVLNESYELQTLHQQTATRWSEVRFGASDNLAHYVLPKIIQSVQDQEPKDRPPADWDIVVGTSNELKTKLLEGSIDAAVFYTAINISEERKLRQSVIAKMPFCLVVGNLGQALKIKTLKQLKQKDWTYIGARQREYANTPAEHWVYRKLGLSPNRFMQTNSKELQKKLVMQGLGYGIFPQTMIDDELKRGKLRMLQGAPPELKDVYWVERKDLKPHSALNIILSRIQMNLT